MKRSVRSLAKKVSDEPACSKALKKSTEKTARIAMATMRSFSSRERGARGVASALAREGPR
jgi:hypothetical protein